MLNGKYIILGGEYPPVENQYAMGHVWFVDSFVPAATPDEEIELIGLVDLDKEAVVGADFEDILSASAVISSDSSVFSSEVETSADRITLTHYAPNELRYSFRTTAQRPAIFSEIYYPKGWKAWIEPTGSYGKVKDGHYRPTAEAKTLELFRADWILRGALIPEGEGEIIMRFEPDSYQLGENISRASSILLILLLLGSSAGMIIFRRRNQPGA